MKLWPKGMADRDCGDGREKPSPKQTIDFLRRQGYFKNYSAKGYPTTNITLTLQIAQR